MWYAPVALLFALFTVTAAILQGINQQRHAIVALIMGVILKFVCNVIFIRYFGTVGAILATAVGFLASVWYTNQQIKNTHTIHSVLYIREHSNCGINTCNGRYGEIITMDSVLHDFA